MMRSMYSAVSALSAHQMKMDVIGNNIANVNTVAFKGSRVTFKETFNQTLKGAGASTGGRGGTNPMQVGLGVDIGAIDVLHKRGTPERTENPTDLMINGEGFFMVSDDVNYINKYYTRAGNFVLDDYGNLVTQDGYKVLGYMADESGNLKSSIEGLRIDRSVVYPPQATEPSPTNPDEDVVIFEGNLDSRAKASDTYDPKPDPTVNADPEKNGIYELDTTITKGKAIYVANDDYKESIGGETTIEVYDKLGNVHKIKLVFTKKEVDIDSGIATWNVDAFYLHPDGNMYKNGDSNIKVEGDAIKDDGQSEDGFQYGSKDTAGSFQQESFTLKFDNKGNVLGDFKMTFKLGKNITNGAAPLQFDINLKKLTQFANESNAGATYIKGYKQGSLEEFAIAPNGEITGVFSNNMRRVLGRVAIANFKNPAGLQKSESNMYIETRNSGIASIGLPGSNGFAQLSPGSLEMANVDLGREFTNMITTQRGFQANSKVITTTDEMLQELVNLKR
ncbi:flagellar hook protein FlgE [Crassaminicella indica]|uniref:Flagellar hook protein FlgE n=1 Tax=Crassaminicella indica TaxID=2855394 RepID=A0ABX8REJ4_9CLOT|nr:flagellar hook protein FlgE [Crassaminicella indica]QXM06145.1 flagellar hook protein FlgE [Crassaminicella indica]